MRPHYLLPCGGALRAMRAPTGWDDEDSEDHDTERDGTVTDGGTRSPQLTSHRPLGSMQEPQKLGQRVFMRQSNGTTRNIATWGQDRHMRGNAEVAH